VQRHMRVEAPAVKERQRRLVASVPVVAEPGVDVGGGAKAGAEYVAHRLVETEMPFGLGLDEREATQLLPAGPAEVVLALAVEVQGRALVERGCQTQLAHPKFPLLAR